VFSIGLSLPSPLSAYRECGNGNDVDASTCSDDACGGTPGSCSYNSKVGACICFSGTANGALDSAENPLGISPNIGNANRRAFRKMKSNGNPDVDVDINLTFN